MTPAEPPLEPALAARGIHRLSWALMAVFAMFSVQAAILALTAPKTRPVSAQAAELPRRANLVDRDGKLLATTLPAFEVWAEPRWIADPNATASALANVLPNLDAGDLAQRLRSSRQAVRVLIGLTPPQRARVHDLGLAGITFRASTTRFYPNLETAGRALGRLNAEGAPIAGLEQGMRAEIDAASADGSDLRLSLDVAIQHAAEDELVRSLGLYKAKAGAAVVVDGRTGEVLALASAPLVDPNSAPVGLPLSELVTGEAFELGSTLKPFTVAMALDFGLTTPDERFDTRAPLIAGGRRFVDALSTNDPVTGPITLAEALARSSNVAPGALALRVGAQRQRAALTRLGLAAPAPLPVGGSEAYVLPEATDPATTAAIGFGRGPLFTVAALAGAYTVFVNEGARAPLRLTPLTSGDPVPYQRVFTAQTSGAVLAMLRQAVADGTGARAEAPGLDIAGKTGTSEKRAPGGGYDPNRNFALFAAVFPAHAPRYVMVVALDEPQRTPASGGLATGGATAAPTAGRIAARIAPLLSLQNQSVATGEDTVAATR